MAGILDFKRYLNTLQTLTELGETFPSSQLTYTFRVGPSGVDGWTATIQWITLIVDSYSVFNDGTPNFNNSQIYGYYAGGNASQYSTGTISIPANMYTGPILPGYTQDVPITVVNISWLKQGQTYDVNLAYIQNWEPGVEIASPFTGIGFEPIFPETSTLTLSGPIWEFYSVTATFTAVSDIPISLGSPNPCYLYANNQLVDTKNFVDHTATFNITLNTGTYTMYCQFGGIRQYGTVSSNTLTFEVFAGVPLIVDQETITPNQPRYFPGQSFSYYLKVIPDPSFPPSGQAITTTNRLNLITEFAPNTQFNFYNDRFYLGSYTTVVNISNQMIDSAILYPETNWTITSFTATGQLYTATVLIENSNTLRTSWDYQTLGRYSAGSYDRIITVAETGTRTRTINDFNLVISQNTSRATVTTPITFTVSTPSTGYTYAIGIYGKRNQDPSYSLLTATNASGQTGFVSTVTFSQTGTWSIYAFYQGDIGQSIYWANRMSYSNTLTNEQTAGRDLSAEFTYNEYYGPEILQVRATSSFTLTNLVSFYNGSTLVGSSTWTRMLAITSITESSYYYSASPAIIFSNPPSSNFANLITYDAPPLGYSTAISTASVLYFTQPNFPVDPTWPDQVKLRAQQGFPLPKTQNALFEYSAVTTNLVNWRHPVALEYNADKTLYAIGGGPFDRNQQLNLWMISNPSQGSTAYLQDYLKEPFISLANYNLQDRGTGNRGGINPNMWRTWRYYDGTNYDLTTTTAFQDILDPITTGSWQVDLLYSYNFGQKNIATSQGLASFADFSSLYFSNTTNYGWDVYDVYRLDQVGDARGYNVIAFTTTIATGTNIFPNPIFGINSALIDGINGRTGSFTITEFIGTLTITHPLQTVEQILGSNVRSSSTIYLYRFSPEIAQTNQVYKNYLPYQDQINHLPSNTFYANGKINRIAMTRQGIFRLPPDSPYFPNRLAFSEVQYYKENTGNELRNFGKKVWTSANIYDQDENYRAMMANAWYQSHVSNWGLIGNQELDHVSFSSYTQRQEYFTETNIFTATVVLANGSIDTNQDLVASWPGTLDLNPIYGNYNPFILRISALNRLTLNSFEIPGNESVSPFVPQPSAQRVSNFKPVRLSASIDFLTTGSVSFHNLTDNEIFFQKNLTPSYDVGSQIFYHILAYTSTASSWLSSFNNLRVSAVTITTGTISQGYKNMQVRFRDSSTNIVYYSNTLSLYVNTETAYIAQPSNQPSLPSYNGAG